MYSPAAKVDVWLLSVCERPTRNSTSVLDAQSGADTNIVILYHPPPTVVIVDVLSDAVPTAPVDRLKNARAVGDESVAVLPIEYK
jgi:hypothetical protein